MRHILLSFSKRLTNLSSANRTLYLPKATRFDLDLLAFGELPKFSNAFHIVDKLICGSRSISLGPVLDPRSESLNRLSARLGVIYKHDKFLYDERGANDLYIGWPFVHGKFSNGSMVRCPLLFFPVVVSPENNEWVLRQRPDVGVSFNKSFLIACEQYHQTRLAEEFLDHVFEDFSDSLTFRTYLYAFLKDNQLGVNFSQELFTDKLNAFQNFSSKEFDGSTRSGELRLVPEAILGLFHQWGSGLLNDYRQMMEADKYSDVEAFFKSKQVAGTHLHAGERIKLKEENFLTALPIDASQEKVVTYLKGGQSAMVQGPPGTGKSQLICNLIADYTSRGKKVLVVCQKKAALDVVYDRLAGVGMQPFVALVHDIKYDRTRIFEQLNTQIDQLEAYKMANTSQSAVQLERLFLGTCKKIDHLLDYLATFKNALFNTTYCGIAVKELYLTSSISAPKLDVSKIYRRLDMQSAKDFQSVIHQYFGYKNLLDGNPWLNLAHNPEQHLKLSEQQVLELLDDIKECTTHWYGKMPLPKNALILIDEVRAICLDGENALELLQLLNTSQTFVDFLLVLQWNTDPHYFDGYRSKLNSCWEDAAPEHTLPSHQLGKTLAAVGKAIQANDHFLRKIFFLFSPDYKVVKRLALLHGLGLDVPDLQQLHLKIKHRMEAESILTQMKSQGWEIAVAGWNKPLIDAWFLQKINSAKSATVWRSMTGFHNYLDPASHPLGGFRKQLEEIRHSAVNMYTKMTGWLQLFSEETLMQLTDLKFLTFVSTAYVPQADAIKAYDSLLNHLHENEKDVLIELEKQTTDPVQAIEIFENSLRLAWIHHIEDENPMLKDASTFMLANAENELQQELKTKAEISQKIIRLRLGEYTYKGVQHNRLYNRVTYRDLHHQVAKKKRIWPIRKLLATFAEEILNLTPCWLASPEVVSAIFPLKELFDLVIFDEASQCFAEEGLPAMERGKQLLVTGDSQQLKPSDLYQVRYDQESDEPDIEVESLLDFAKLYLETLSLKEHYRSHAPELIEFSNRHFYKQSLEMLPSWKKVNEPKTCMHYIKVDGIWENNTNVAEAEAVVRLLQQAFTQEARPSIGVVTFNFKQAELISEMLTQWANANSIVIPDSIFVKNIENVQGDERDTILFSLGYAPNREGKLAMHFGSLNQEGGANRLNVAVTRARKSIYLITSLLPAQLNTDAAKYPGPKLLRQYLDFVFQVADGGYVAGLPEKQLQAFGVTLEKYILGQHVEKASFTKSSYPIANLMVMVNDQVYGFVATDDNDYFQAVSLKESHAYKHFQAEQKGWKLCRIYSREFWNDAGELVHKTLNNFIHP